MFSVDFIFLQVIFVEFSPLLSCLPLPASKTCKQNVSLQWKINLSCAWHSSAIHFASCTLNWSLFRTVVNDDVWQSPAMTAVLQKHVRWDACAEDAS